MTETVGSIGEFGLIRRINDLVRREGVTPEGLSAGIGDDTAVLRPRGGWDLLVTCDSMVERRHFLPEHTTPRALGRRAMAINISDVGAMGGRPVYALVSLGLRGQTAVADIEEMYRGFLEELNPFGAAVAGGNLTGTAHAQFIDVTLIGEVEAGRALRRSTARPGDLILVTGWPGRSAAGLELLLGGQPVASAREQELVAAYNEPRHRAREGRAVALSGGASAMIDTSDGFLGDLAHICEESRVGAEVWEAKIPVNDSLSRVAERLARDPMGWVLGESDDYELIITCPPGRVDTVRTALHSVGDAPVREVGRMVDGPARVEIVSPAGDRRLALPRGWDHFRRDES